MVLLDTGTPGTSREIYSEDADGETRTRNPSVINRNNSFQKNFSFCRSPGRAYSKLDLQEREAYSEIRKIHFKD